MAQDGTQQLQARFNHLRESADVAIVNTWELQLALDQAGAAKDWTQRAMEQAIMTHEG